MRKFTLTTLAIIVFVAAARTQSTTPFIFNSAGGSFNDASSYYRFEWSIGELSVINMMSTGDSSSLMLHGVLQPGTEMPLYPQTVLFEAGDYRIFPNPTTGPFELNFFVTYPGKMELQLTDATGRVLETRSYLYDGVRRIQMFDISRHPNGLYYVIATLTPTNNRSLDNINIVRRNGLRIIKLK